MTRRHDRGPWAIERPRSDGRVKVKLWPNPGTRERALSYYRYVCVESGKCKALIDFVCQGHLPGALAITIPVYPSRIDLHQIGGGFYD